MMSKKKNTNKNTASVAAAPEPAVFVTDAEESTVEEVEAEIEAEAEVEAVAPVEAPVEKELSPVKIRRAASTETVSHNPALIVWPTDVWGITKNLKKEFLAAASRINGQSDKKELLDATLRIVHAHLEAKYTKDSEIRTARVEKAQAAEQLNLF